MQQSATNAILYNTRGLNYRTISDLCLEVHSIAYSRSTFIADKVKHAVQTKLDRESQAIDCKLETDGGRPVRAAIPPLRAAERKEVKVKLNGDANQRIDFIWRRALRVSQTDGELSEQSCAELRDEVFICDRLRTDGELSEQSCAELRDEVFICDIVLAVYRLLLTELYRKLNPALRGYRGGLYEQPPWRSSAELRAERATSMEELCRAPPWS
ncbi:hypothetical protein Bbelb_354970 [Branchiostoma belcheri]|nr:hypothetical protein Bbelb_354970 [Branchiostoma belcheri]